jgi:DHA2 family multidrug resistance protein
MVSLQCVLEEGNRDGWFESKMIAFLAVVATIALVGFIGHELETESPVVDLRVFADRGYAAAPGVAIPKADHRARLEARDLGGSSSFGR